MDKEVPTVPTVVDERKTIAYARVSSCEPKEDLVRQSQVLELYCAEHGYKYELITDLGSGMTYYEKGLTNLINQILNNEVKRLIITHKDRLLRFGADGLCQALGSFVLCLVHLLRYRSCYRFRLILIPNSLRTDPVRARIPTQTRLTTSSGCFSLTKAAMLKFGLPALASRISLTTLFLNSTL